MGRIVERFDWEAIAIRAGIVRGSITPTGWFSMRFRPLIALVVFVGFFACGKDSSESLQRSGTPTPGQAMPGRPGDASVTGGVAEGAQSRREAYDMKATAAPAPPSSPIAVAPEQGPIGSLPSSSQGIVPSMVIRTGDARVEVDSLEVGVQKVRQLAARLGGYVGNTQMQGGEGQERSAMLELKLPADRFDQAVEGLNGLGKKLDWYNGNAQDVGEEFVDITARVQNAKRLEERLITLLARGTGKLEEVLQVERELARVREEIERYEGRLRFLRTRAAVSTLTITVYEKGPIVRGGDNPIIDAFRDAWRNFVTFTAGLIKALGVLVPLAALGALVWMLLRRFWPGWNSTPPAKSDRGPRPNPRDESTTP
jgi:hypothetical protein